MPKNISPRESRYVESCFRLPPVLFSRDLFWGPPLSRSGNRVSRFYNAQNSRSRDLRYPDGFNSDGRFLVGTLPNDVDLLPRVLSRWTVPIDSWGFGTFTVLFLFIALRQEISLTDFINACSKNQYNQLSDVDPQTEPLLARCPWYKDVIYFLQELRPPDGLERNKARDLKLKAVIYCLVDQILY
jgi:hypothetical protein